VSGLRWIPYLLALFFLLNSLRSLPCGNPIDSDAARHLMNGAFVHDLLRSGEITHPVQYGKQYYSRLPGISLPFHPPLFPAVEAVFFSVFGVKLAVARLAVSLAVVVSVLLFYRLVLVTHQSHAVAVSAVLFFFTWRWTEFASNDVMLEIPALALALWALSLIAKPEANVSFGRWIAFALVAGAAVWTKQTAVFLGAVPFVFAVLVRSKKKLLLRPAVWVSACLFAGIVFALMLMSASFRWTGVELATHHISRLHEIVLGNLPYYVKGLVRTAGIVFAALAGAAVVAALFRLAKSKRDSKDALYLAWALPAFAVLIELAIVDDRYLLFVVAPLSVLAFAALERWGRAVLGEERGWWPAVGLAAVLAAVNLATPLPFLNGPIDAARAVVDGRPARIVYCGRTNGAFIAGVRTLDPEMRETVLRGDKLPPETFTAAGFEEFAHRYGINYVVIEHTSLIRPWNALFAAPAPSMDPVREISLSSSDPLANGQIRVYRFTNPSPNPESALTLRLRPVGTDLEVKF
jgi:4-amino-4-deoxy-L-arabinose transferase-like glycosyltransferase